MFSYKEYKEIIQIIKESGRMANFKQARGKDQFIIMRHDVEFSVDRAFALSKLELSMDFTSTYFFQWTNNSYNILSKRNMDMIHYMHERGHEIGLHFRPERSDRYGSDPKKDHAGDQRAQRDVRV